MLSGPRGKNKSTVPLTHILRTALCFVFLLAAGSASKGVKAQTLDEQIIALTAGFCVAAGIDYLDPKIGPKLAGICTPPTGPPPVVGPSPPVGGGAAAGVSGSSMRVSGAADVEWRKKRRRKDGKGDQEAMYQVADLVRSARTEETYLEERLAVFVSVDYVGRDKSITAFAAGHESERWGATAGGDYRLTPVFVGGLAIHANRLDGDFSTSGRFRTDSLGAIAYGVYATESGYFADFSLAGFYKSFEVVRFISGRFNLALLDNERTASDAEGYELSSRLRLGKDFSVGRFTFGPRASVNYLFTHIDGVEEEGTSGLQLVYDGRSLDSLQSVVGIEASVAFSISSGVLQPQFGAEWVHEFKADQHSIDVRFAEDHRDNPTWFSFQTDKPDRDFFNLRAGLVIAIPGGIQGFIEARAILGHDYFAGYGGAAGLRFAL